MSNKQATILEMKPESLDTKLEENQEVSLSRSGHCASTIGGFFLFSSLGFLGILALLGYITFVYGANNGRWG